MVRALVSHQYGPGLILVQCYMWAEFDIISRLAPYMMTTGTFSNKTMFIVEQAICK